YLTSINDNYIKTGKAVPEFNYYVMNLNTLCESSLYVYYVDAPAKGNMDGKAIMAKFQKDFEQYMKDQSAAGF
ncbi:MAG: carbohydrate ABC transporter substrate-binding protein, partial [Oscillospiraceae bacterium]